MGGKGSCQLLHLCRPLGQALLKLVVPDLEAHDFQLEVVFVVFLHPAAQLVLGVLSLSLVLLLELQVVVLIDV